MRLYNTSIIAHAVTKLTGSNNLNGVKETLFFSVLTLQHPAGKVKIYCASITRKHSYLLK